MGQTRRDVPVLPADPHQKVAVLMAYRKGAWCSFVEVLKEAHRQGFAPHTRQYVASALVWWEFMDERVRLAIKDVETMQANSGGLYMVRPIEKRSERYYTPADTEYVRRNYYRLSLHEMCCALHRTVPSIRRKAWAMGITNKRRDRL